VTLLESYCLKPFSIFWCCKITANFSVSFTIGLSNDWTCKISLFSNFFLSKLLDVISCSLDFAKSYNSLILSCLRLFSLSSSKPRYYSSSTARSVSTLLTFSPYSFNMSLNYRSASGFPTVFLLKSASLYSESLSNFCLFSLLACEIWANSCFLKSSISWSTAYV